MRLHGQVLFRAYFTRVKLVSILWFSDASLLLVFLRHFDYNAHMDTEKPSDIIPKDLKITHDGYFQETFQVERIARAALKKVLPKEALASLSLEGLTVDDRTMSDDMFKEKSADVIYRVPIKKTKKHIHFFAILEHKSYQDFQTIFQLWGYVYRICLREFQLAEQRGENVATYRLRR
jgi:hypothetical protein